MPLGNVDTAEGEPVITVTLSDRRKWEIVPWVMPLAMPRKLVTKLLVSLATYDDAFAHKMLADHFSASADGEFVWPDQPYDLW